MDRISGIYCIRNKTNGKVYIGQSVHIFRRWHYHKYKFRNNNHPNSYLQASWNKYGEENFEFEILEECNDNLSDKESIWCNKFQSFEPKNGYNSAILLSGRNYKLSLESREKIGKSHKGTKHTKASKKKMSESRLGIKLSDITKSRMSLSKKGMILSETHKKNLKNSIRNSIKHKNHVEHVHKTLCKPINQYDLKGNFIQDFPSITKASEDLKIPHSAISGCVTGRYSRAKIFKFKYK